ncbi:MAG: peptidoglycan editing factor PgeF [Spirochaetes bacterium]|nr:peptidoglycan editing factor PgeF [Spirochaetota bacterium]
MTDFRKNGNSVFQWNTFLPLNIGTVGCEVNNVDYSIENLNSIKHNEIRHLSKILNIDSPKIFILDQVHGDSIIIIDEVPGKQSDTFPEADGIITDISGLCLIIRTADCVPVFAYDNERKVIGAVHAGWRGCRQNITGKMIREMQRVYRSESRNIYAFILPSIGPQNYNVNADVADFFPIDKEIKNGNIYLNLWTNIERSLLEEGVLGQNIYNSAVSTFNSYDFFSYRRGDSGRNLNFGYIKNSSQ